jgi:hypothetical protein
MMHFSSVSGKRSFFAYYIYARHASLFSPFGVIGHIENEYAEALLDGLAKRKQELCKSAFANNLT